MPEPQLESGVPRAMPMRLCAKKQALKLSDPQRDGGQGRDELPPRALGGERTQLGYIARSRESEMEIQVKSPDNVRESPRSFGGGSRR
jgi:hypothetical protein